MKFPPLPVQLGSIASPKNLARGVTLAYVEQPSETERKKFIVGTWRWRSNSPSRRRMSKVVEKEFVKVIAEVGVVVSYRTGLV
jgi:hypothetical protein